MSDSPVQHADTALPPYEVMAFAADHREDAQTVAHELAKQGISCQVKDSGWGTGEWVIELKFSHRLARLLDLGELIDGDA
jgi:hypothetical protein